MTDSESQNQEVQPEKTPENLAIAGIRMTPIKIALIFAVGGVLWVSITDLLVTRYFGEDMLLAETLKGLLFVGVATALVYWLARRALLEMECKWTEKQLKKTQNLLGKTLASLGDAVFLINPSEWTILQCNPAAERLFGYAAEEMIGRNTQFLYELSKDYENFGRESENVLEEGETYHGKFHMQAKDGTLIQTEHTITAIDKELGWRDGVISIVHDITERKKAIEAFRKSEAHYRTLVETIPDLVWLKDTQGVYLGCNQAFERFFGAKEEEIVGKTDYDFKDKEQADFFREHDRKALEIRGPSVNEETLIFAEGGYSGLFETIKTPMQNAEGEVIGVLGVARDITKRKEAENALRQSEAKFRALFENSPEAVFLTTPDGRIEAANPAACDMFGWSEQEFPTMTRSSVLDTDDPRLAQGMEERRRTGLVRDVELTAISKDGTRFPVEVDSVLLSQDKKQSFVIMRNISRRKQEEQERLELERQLHQAQKMDSVGRLAGGIAHDFNNMLSVIVGNMELAMLSDEVSSQLHDYHQETLNAAKRSSDLTKQLLAFARKQVIEPKVLNLNDSIAGMLRMISRMLPEDIDLTWQPAPTLWPVKMDPAQINQILVNLVLNARDAISGVGKITLETHNAELAEDDCKQRPGCLPGRYVQLVVADDGEGMDEETRKQIFEPFFTTKDPDEGTGLGLATVYGIIKQNEGFIYAESKPGQGSAFQIYLLPAEASEMAEDNEAAAEKLAMGNETILLVEDEISLLTVVRQLLEELGYKVLAASKPSEALAMALEYPGPIHLLVTDIIMPDMNGSELWDEIDKKRPGLKCLFMSGHTANIISERGVLDEGLKFIQKPFTIGELAAKLRLVLEA